MRAGLLGQITTPASRNALEPGVEACADNALYTPGGYPGDRGYLRWLSSLPDPARIRFAVAPDVVADHARTWERSVPMLDRIREVGLPVAFCAQNGATPDDLPWDGIDVVFLAGIVECLPCEYLPRVEDLPMKTCPVGHRMTEWKCGAAARAVLREAHRLGKSVHMGRVNSLRRFRYAVNIGCDSVDGTFLKYGPDTNLARIRPWIVEADTQHGLFDFAPKGL